MDKECRWIATYPRPWELLPSVWRMVSAGKEQDRILNSLTMTTVKQSTVGHERGGYTMLTSLNGRRGGGFGIGRVG